MRTPPSRIFALLALALLGCFVVPAVAQQGRGTDTFYLGQRYAAGRKELARYSEKARRKMCLEFTYADRQAMKLLEEARNSGKIKGGQSGQWAYDIYRKPLFRKYRITETGRQALESEGIDRDWPRPTRWP